MLSRTAENLYWLARYVERAEYIARTIDATLRVTALPAAYIGKTNEWESALLTAGVSQNFYKVYNVSPNIFSMTVTQWITKRLNATVDYYFLSSSYYKPFGAPAVMSFAGPKKADLVVNYNLPIKDTRSVDFYVKLENYGNVRYTDNGFLAPQFWGIGGVKFNF